MTPDYQRYLDKIIADYKAGIVKNLVKFPGIEEGTYFLNLMTQDLMAMLYSIISRNMLQQEAKAYFKAALDQFLVSKGMSVRIDEFGPGEENKMIIQ